MDKELQASILHTMLRHLGWIRSVNLAISDIPSDEDLGDWRKPVCVEDFHADYQKIFTSIIARSKTIGADAPHEWRDVMKSSPHDRYLKFEHDVLRIRIDHISRMNQTYKTGKESNFAGLKCVYAIVAFETRAHYLFLRTAPQELFEEMAKGLKALEQRINKNIENETNNDA